AQFIAGTDTVSLTLYYAINLMASNQEIQIKVRNEIEEMIGMESKVSFIDMKFLNFTQAVIAEVQRFACIVPFGVPHSNESND
ncbi:cytochrome P450 2G1-like protein, partial [Dinothrombium tinctorium]